MRKHLLLVSLILAASSFAAAGMVLLPGKVLAKPISQATASTLCKGSWTKQQATRICTWCGKALVGVRRCHLVGCRGARCEYVVLPREGTTRAARITLNQCIGNHDKCTRQCVLGVLLPPGEGGGLSDYEYKDCRNRCDANHFGCVDTAMDLSPGR